MSQLQKLKTETVRTIAAVLHRVFVKALGPEVTVEGDEFHHSVRVVRLREGDRVELFDGSGEGRFATLAKLDRDHASFRTEDAVPQRESSLRISLAMSVIQLEKFELVLQKATELGVHSIVPVVAERGEVRRERYANRRNRWERIVFEAVKQSGRLLIPAIEEPCSFGELFGEANTIIVFDADEEPSALPPLERGTVAIGPEGGWSASELQMARERGGIFQRLGPRRLRAETAAITALSAMASRFGDL